MPRKQVFNANQFTPTDHATAADKAKFGNHFVKFVQGGFKRTQFPKWFYVRLSMTFGHIAHYNIDGFYATWFADADKLRKFIEITLSYPCYGNPGYTFCDVEREIQKWIKGHEQQVNDVIQANAVAEHKAHAAESERLAGLQDQTHQDFVVAAKSQSTGPFGHYGYIMVAEDGSAWEVQRSMMYSWSNGQKVRVPLFQGEPNWTTISGVECPLRKQNAPPAVVKQLFAA